MLKRLIVLFGIALIAGGGIAVADDAATADEIAKLKEEIEDLEDRVMTTERKSALDRIDFTGDFRFEAHSIKASIPTHFDGMHLQNLMVNTIFYFGATGMMPGSIDDIDAAIQQNYAQYLYFTDNLTFDQLKNFVGGFPPEMMNQLMQFLLPNTYTPGYSADNTIAYTSRLRLQLDADVAKNVDFQGRLSMYKVWGDSTGVQVFSGQPTQMAIDGITSGVPNSDIVRVERAYFNWKNIGGAPMYLSIGRRPSTNGVPLNYRNDEPRGGTPMGSLINFQFDGITFGYRFGEHSTARLCYGMGYESGWGNGDTLVTPEDRLSDASFFGVNWDIWHDDDMMIQATVARAFDVTDGFAGHVVMPNDPVTGIAAPPAIMRYAPSANLGDIDMASIIITRRDGPLDWFASVNYSSSDPNPVTTPFGGLFSDPFETPEKQNGHMYYLGLRYNFANDKTKLGVEFNHGSEYWFNMAIAEDDFMAPKTAARGDVFELYLTHRIAKRFLIKLDYITYEYDYSGSGWHVGAPKDLNGDMPPVLGFPTYDSIDKFMLSMSARF